MNKVNFEKTADLINKQDEWRDRCINLIASENVQSKKVRAFAGSDFTHRYAEGHPGERYYKGTNFIDQIESDLKLNLKNIFKCEHTEVRPISGTNSNEAIFSKFVNKEDIVMANSTPGGGHISHHRLGALGKFTKNIIDFPLTADGYHLDIEKTRDLINRIKPKMIVLGKSLFLFPEPIAELREVCEQNKTKIIYDGAHVLGLIAGKCFQDPLGDGALMVSASTHKTYFGSQRGLILSNMDAESWRKVDRGAFPGSSSNHHLGTLAQMALSTVEFMEFGDQYAAQVIKNAKHLAAALGREGFCVAAKHFGYTESHQVAVNVNEYGGGSLISTLLEKNDIILNMNMLPHEPLKNHNNPEGLRIGVAEMTRYGMNEPEMEKIAELMKEVVIEKKSVKEEVNKLRANYQNVKYSFDNPEA
jgi:glycine hydroxymethyltransferase